MPDDETPPLRDRNWFFYVLLNGDRMTYDKVAPAWRERRRNERNARRAGKRPDPVDDPKRPPDKPWIRKPQVQVDADKKAKRWCGRMRCAIRGLRREIHRARTSQPNEKKIKKRIGVVREYAHRLNEHLAPDIPFDRDKTLKLDLASTGGEWGIPS